jgi:hypothetical protein
MKAWTGNPDDFPRMAAKPRPTWRYLRLVFDAVKNGEINTWDFQFNFLLQHARQDFLHPNVNLITNIGFAGNATHTSNANDPNASLPRGEVEFPLTAPVEGRAYEDWLDRKVFVIDSLATKAKNRLYRWSALILDRK